MKVSDRHVCFASELRHVERFGEIAIDAVACFPEPNEILAGEARAS